MTVPTIISMPEKNEEETKTLVLTRQEWDDLRAICAYYTKGRWSVGATMVRRFRFARRLADQA